MKKILVTGGAGFIGSNIVKKLLQLEFEVTVYDNLSNGNKWHLKDYFNNKNLNFIEAEISDENSLNTAIKSQDLVIHLASNADIAKAAQDPDIDFENGIYLTRCVLEAMRKQNIKKIIFTSGSGVYGEVPSYPVTESFSPLLPVSTYGAQKLASEAFIAAYSFMFDIKAVIFRFANVVGPQQTHGVAYDFLLKLQKNKSSLEILGDGTQTKPYIHIDDIFEAFFLVINFPEKFKDLDIFNVATNDCLTVTEIANMVCESQNINEIKFEYKGGGRGWKADVPVYMLDSSKLRRLGWNSKFSSKEAMHQAISSMSADILAGNIK